MDAGSCANDEFMKILGRPVNISDIYRAANGQSGHCEIPVFFSSFPLSADPDAEDPHRPGFTVGYGYFEAKVYKGYKLGRADLSFRHKFDRFRHKSQGHWLESLLLSVEIDFRDSAFSHDKQLAHKLMQTVVRLWYELGPNRGSGDLELRKTLSLLRFVSPEQFEGVSEKAIMVLAKACATCVATRNTNLDFSRVPETFSANRLAAFILATWRLPNLEKDNESPDRV